MMRGGPMRSLTESSDERARNTGAVLRRLLRLFQPYKFLVLVSFVMVILSAASQGMGPFLTGIAVDRFISKGISTGLGWVILALVGVFLVGMLATRFQILFMSRAAQNMLADLRQTVFEKIEKLSLQYLESKQAGDLMSRLVNDIDALNSFFSQALTQLIGSIFALLGIAVAMLALSWKLGLAVLVVVPVLFITTNVFAKWARHAFKRTRETLGDVSADLEEELGGVKVAQAFNRTDENVRRFAQRNAANRDANVNATAVTSAFAPTMDLISTLDTALVAGMGGALAISGQVSIGVVIAFLQYVQNFFRPIQTVAQQWTMAQSAFAAAERVFEVMDMTETIQDAPDAVQVNGIKGDISFENVTFSYSDGIPVLKNASFTVKAGQMVAVVGPTGAGKTTLASLLPRFYDATSGQVLIDGVNVRAYEQRGLRANFGIVTQEPFLFSGTILENIRYGKLTATEEDVTRAAQAAYADEFIQRLPKGYQTEVGERGKMLSQGQRQLISIARAILADPQILILDEATASIDTSTELLIQKALHQLLKSRTSIVIAHRLSTIRNADLVLVIEDGEIVERGSHESLIQQDGLYSELYNRQFYKPETQKLNPSTSAA